MGDLASASGGGSAPSSGSGSREPSGIVEKECGAASSSTRPEEIARGALGYKTERCAERRSGSPPLNPYPRHCVGGALLKRGSPSGGENGSSTGAGAAEEEAGEEAGCAAGEGRGVEAP